jgi:hypothetical protein
MHLFIKYDTNLDAVHRTTNTNTWYLYIQVSRTAILDNSKKRPIVYKNFHAHDKKAQWLGYRLEGPGLESRERERERKRSSLCSKRSHRIWPHPASYKIDTDGYCRGVYRGWRMRLSALVPLESRYGMSGATHLLPSTT